MKFLKKAVSALLASIMCIPAGILNFAEAEEENTVTTVTLADTENGFMQFSEDSMESSTASQDGYHMVQVNEAGELEQVENDGAMWLPAILQQSPPSGRSVSHSCTSLYFLP